MNTKNSCAALALSFLLAGTAEAAAFPSAGIDSFASYGQFDINVASSFSNLFPGVDSLLTENGFISLGSTALGNNTWESPKLSGGPSTTVISHGTPYYSPSGLGPAGTLNTVNTQMTKLDLKGGPSNSVEVVAGTALPGTTITPTYGQVVSNTMAGGFPANSFFDVFAQVALAGLPTGDYLYNTSPILLQATNLDSFPPPLVRPYYVLPNENGTGTANVFLYNASSGQSIDFGLIGAATPNPGNPTGAEHFVPLPAAIFFVAPALAGVFGWTRRKNNAIMA